MDEFSALGNSEKTILGDKINKRFHVFYGIAHMLSSQMLMVPLLVVKTMLLLERDAWSMVKFAMARNRRVRPRLEMDT